MILIVCGVYIYISSFLINYDSEITFRRSKLGGSEI